MFILYPLYFFIFCFIYTISPLFSFSPLFFYSFFPCSTLINTALIFCSCLNNLITVTGLVKWSFAGQYLLTTLAYWWCDCWEFTLESLKILINSHFYILSCYMNLLQKIYMFFLFIFFQFFPIFLARFFFPGKYHIMQNIWGAYTLDIQFFYFQGGK